MKLDCIPNIFVPPDFDLLTWKLVKRSHQSHWNDSCHIRILDTDIATDIHTFSSAPMAPTWIFLAIMALLPTSSFAYFITVSDDFDDADATSPVLLWMTPYYGLFF